LGVVTFAGADQGDGGAVLAGDFDGVTHRVGEGAADLLDGLDPGVLGELVGDFLEEFVVHGRAGDLGGDGADDLVGQLVVHPEGLVFEDDLGGFGGDG